MELDGEVSPDALVRRIFELVPDMPIPVPLEQLCEQLDIISIKHMVTQGFEAALITDVVKSSGAILVAEGQSPQRRRFSIAHELGHFLIPSHRVPQGGQFLCSEAQLRLLSRTEQHWRARMEAEANRFAGLLLIPPSVLRSYLSEQAIPDLAHLLKLARLFDVSREAMAHSYAACHHEAIAILMCHHCKLRCITRSHTMPWILSGPGCELPSISLIGPAGTLSPITECNPEDWFAPHIARTITSLTSQTLSQQNAFSTTLLHATQK